MNRWVKVSLFIIVLILPIVSYAIDIEMSAPVETLLQQQKNIDDKLEKIYQNRNYTLERPYIEVNPYGNAPLSAIAIFQTNQPMRLEIIVGTEPSIVYTIDTFNKLHSVPIIGLHANQETFVKIVAIDSEGNNKEYTTKLKGQNENLTTLQQDTINTISTSIINEQKMEESLTLVEPFLLIDNYGQVRWALNMPHNNGNVTILKNNHLLVPSWVPYEGVSYHADGFMEIDLLGKIYRYYRVGNGMHHEVIELPSNNFLVASGSSFGTSIREDSVVEVDRESGKILREWGMAHTLGLIPRDNLLYLEYDPYHINALAYDKNDNTIIVSLRNQSSVIKFDKESGEIKWILGDHKNWNDKYKGYLLNPIGGEFEWQYGQHSVKLIDTNIVAVYDNGNYRAVDTTDTIVDAMNNYSRGVLYKIDEEKMQVEQIWQYGKLRGNELYTPFLGEIDYLKDSNNFLITFGGITKENGQATDKIGGEGVQVQSKIVEVDERGNIIWELSKGGANYRSERINIQDTINEIPVFESSYKFYNEIQQDKVITNDLTNVKWINGIDEITEVKLIDGMLLIKGWAGIHDVDSQESDIFIRIYNEDINIYFDSEEFYSTLGAMNIGNESSLINDYSNSGFINRINMQKIPLKFNIEIIVKNNNQHYKSKIYQIDITD